MISVFFSQGSECIGYLQTTTYPHYHIGDTIVLSIISGNARDFVIVGVEHVVDWVGSPLGEIVVNVRVGEK